jgi:hypothetical protein
LLQFAFGQRNGLERRSDEAGRERVVLARGVDVGEEAVEDEPEAEVDACAERGWYEACEGDATRELEGVFAGVVELELYRSVGGTQL